MAKILISVGHSFDIRQILQALRCRCLADADALEVISANVHRKARNRALTFPTFFPILANVFPTLNSKNILKYVSSRSRIDVWRHDCSKDTFEVSPREDAGGEFVFCVKEQKKPNLSRISYVKVCISLWKIEP